MDTRKSVPIFDKNSLGFYREEKEGHVTISPSDRQIVERKLLNRTAKDILDAIDGKNTVFDIVSHISKLYPDAPRKNQGRSRCDTVQHVEKWNNHLEKGRQSIYVRVYG